ncbi:MAG: SxtJ family membrane protein [Pelobacteraceae bacterium]
MKRNHNHSRIEALETMAVLAAFFLALSLITGRPAYVWPALALLATGLFLKPLAEIIARGWLKFSGIIGGFSNRVILTFLFVVVLTPMALLFRLFTKNPLAIKRDGSAASYFYERNHTYSADDLSKMG